MVQLQLVDQHRSLQASCDGTMNVIGDDTLTLCIFFPPPCQSQRVLMVIE